MAALYYGLLNIAVEKREQVKGKYEVDLQFTMYKVQFVKLGGYAARGAKPSLAYRPRLERGTHLGGGTAAAVVKNARWAW